MTGDSDHWEDWLDRHVAALVLFAGQWAPRRVDAEDIVQEAFVRFWRSREKVSDPTAYLYACVRNCALDWIRSDKRRSRREESVARPEGEELFDASVLDKERRTAVQAALLALPEPQREVLVMKIWGGLSFAQIATALDVSAGTAASRYRYALAKLHKELAEEAIP